MAQDNPASGHKVNPPMAEDNDPETGCRQLQEKLHQELKKLSRRIDGEEDARIRLINQSNRIAASIFLQLGELPLDTDSSNKPNDRRHPPNEGFGNLLEDLGRLETETLASLIQRNARTADDLAGNQIAMKETPPEPPNEEFRPEEKKPERDGRSQTDSMISIQVLGQIIRNEKKNPFPAEHRRRLLELHSNALEVVDIIDSLNIRVSEMFESYNKICEISNCLEKASNIYWRKNAAHAAVRAATNRLYGRESQGTVATVAGHSATTLAEEHLKTLTTELNSVRNALTVNEAVMKKCCAQKMELLPAVTAIMKEIQILCGNQIVTDLPEVTVWKIGTAARRWPALKGALPAGCEISKVDPDQISTAFIFLMQHEELLEAYNKANHGRLKSAALSAEIEILQAAVNDVQVNSLRTDGTLDTSKKLAKVVFEADREAQLASEELDSVIGDIARLAGLPQNILRNSSKDIWKTIWKSACERAIDHISKELDWIDAKVNEANSKIAAHG